MWTWLTTFIGLRSWYVYAILIASVLGITGLLVYSVWRNGANSEKTNQLTETLKRMTQDAKRNARIERLSTSDVRKQLRKRWTAK